MTFPSTNLALTTENNDSLKITGGRVITENHFRFQFTVDGGAPKVRDYYIRNGILGIELGMGDDPVVKKVIGHELYLKVVICGTRRNINLSFSDTDSRFYMPPFDFNDRLAFREPDAPSLKDATPDKVLELPLETGQEFHDRLMPFLHAAAWGFIEEAPALDHELKNKRHKNSELRVKLPIGYLTRELDRHAKGSATMSREDTEALVREVNDAFTTYGTWYEHHLDHDVVELARAHEKLKVVFDREDGSEWAVDLKQESGQHAANDFAQLRTHFFGQALYHSREFITHRRLVFVDKE